MLLSNVLDTDLNIYVASSKDSLRYAIEHADDENSLIIADEGLVSKIFESVLGKKCYCLFITRKVYTNISMSYKSLLLARRDLKGITHFYQKYKFSDILEYKPAIDVILTEDSGYGKTFLEALSICAIKTSNGKGGISKSLKECSEEYSNILCIFDAGSVASHIKTIYERVQLFKSRDIHVMFLTPECFEQVLLCSKYYSYDEDIYKYFKLEYNNTENFCEKEIVCWYNIRM